MRRAERAIRVQRLLDEHHPDPAIPLRHNDPFTLLVAVVLSAQSTDKKVNEITPALFARGPGPREMATLDVEEIRVLIRQIGLAPQKSRALKALSQRIMEQHDGEVPRSFTELEALAGVGHKTASVLMSQAFGQPAFPVDTHIHRLAARWRLSDGKSVERSERDLKALFPKERWNKLHLQIIYFGRSHCPALYHDLDGCPICSWAASKKRKDEERRINAQRRKRTRAPRR